MKYSARYSQGNMASNNRKNPFPAGMDTSRLQRISRHLQTQYIDKERLAGCQILIYRRNQVVLNQMFGLMDREGNKPMQEDTLFRIYSMTKPITSVALMTLYEEGHFQLSDPVSRFIPEWKDLRVYQAGVYPDFQTRPCRQEMTVRDLLTHMSGLTYGFLQSTNVDRAYRRLKIAEEHDRWTLRDFVQKLAKLPLEFSPGEAWNYSVATDVVGYLCEVISGQPFDRFLQERIFDPLGMQDTFFVVPPDKLHRFAACYERDENKRLVLQDDPADSEFARPKAFFSGGGGLVSSTADYLRFCRMLLGGGALDDTRIIGPKTLEFMTQNHLPHNDDLTRWARGSFSETIYEGVGFGLGFSVHLGMQRAPIIGSTGEFAWGGLASTAFWVDPAEDLAVIFMTQFIPSNTFNIRSQLKALVYSAIVS